MDPGISEYHNRLSPEDQQICLKLARLMDEGLREAQSKIWHAHPVWFIDGNPIAGYSKQKAGIRLMFWSGADFGEKDLNIIGKRFKDASVFFKSEADIVPESVQRWLEKSKVIQWDYKNLIKRKGKLERLLPTIA